MSKIKHTKTELKAQRTALKRYERFLPMLQLKKQQLQTEIQSIDRHMAENAEEGDNIRRELDSWVELFSEPLPIEDLLKVTDIRISENNIAGVSIPVLEDIVFQRIQFDLFILPYWADPAIAIIERLIRQRIRHRILGEQKRLIGEELRITTQRVNLFEKVKIPECRDNIRVIRIFLGDQETASVVRAKIAKKRTQNAGDAALNAA